MARKSDGSRGGLVKALLGGLAGLLSGAGLTYFTPLVDRLVKPAPPRANFAVTREGLTVTFQNLSPPTRGMQGWWEFGDGSPLEALVPEQEFIKHTYVRPGEYTVKLIIRNALNEENERSLTLNLSESAADTAAPRVQSLQAVALSGVAYAPATFRLSAEVQNARLCVWESGNDQPMEVQTEPGTKLERLVTFATPGRHAVKLAAFNGDRHDQRVAFVEVLPAPAGSLTAVLRVSDQAMQVTRQTRQTTLGVSLPPDLKQEVWAFTRTIPARPGWSIVGVKVLYPRGDDATPPETLSRSVDGNRLGFPTARELTLTRDPEGKLLRLTGGLARPGSKGQSAGLAVPLQIIEERSTAVSRLAVPVTASLALPGSVQLALPPAPAGWTQRKTQATLELREGDRVVWQQAGPPAQAVVTLKGRRYRLTTSPSGEGLRVTLQDSP